MRRLLIGLAVSFLLAWQGAAHADITPQLRHQIEQQAKAISLSRSAILEELRLTGFLDDKKTAQLAMKSTPTNALAWAALQAEEAKPGTAVELLETVAKGMAAKHVAAIRYEPELAYLFKGAPQGPITAPPARKFAFSRVSGNTGNAIASLPAKAQKLLVPLAKYAIAHPGGVQALLTGTLRLRPADALELERSSRSVDDLLAAAIRQAEPPPAERYREVMASLIKHGGRAIHHEEVLAMFPDAVRSGEPDVTKARWRDGAPLSVAQRQALMTEERLVNQIVVSAFADAAQAGPDTLGAASPTSMFGSSGGGATGSGSGSGSGIGSIFDSTAPVEASGGGAPSYNERVNNLHTIDRADSRSGPPSRSFTSMRSIGGGRGGGGVVVGAPVTFDPQLRPSAARWETMSKDGVQYGSPRVTLKDGSVVFARPVRQDIALAAQRLVFGDSKEAIRASSETQGDVLISLLNNARPLLNKTAVAEFLVHPAIADLAVGRDLIGCDGAEFLFPTVFKLMLDAAPQVRRVAAGSVDAHKWFKEISEGTYSGWYRYVDRQVVVKRDGAALIVAATGKTAPHVLFELVRPAEKEDEVVVTPELNVVIDGLIRASPQFRSLNDLISTVAVLRWIKSNQVRIEGNLPGGRRLAPARTVVLQDERATFGPRSQSSYLKEDIKARSTAWNKLARQEKLTVPPALLSAIIRDRTRLADIAAMRALGYSQEKIIAALKKQSPVYQSFADVARAMILRGELSGQTLPRWMPAFQKVWLDSGEP